MFYTLNILKELVLRRLHGGDIPSDSPYLPAAIVLEVVGALREDLKLELLQRRSGTVDDKSTVSQYIATYVDVIVLHDKVTQRDYIDLPSGYMSLKHNKGIHWISSMKTPWKQMIPVVNPGVTINLPHADLEGENYSYYAEGQKVFFLRELKKDSVEKLLLKLIIPAPDTLGWDDELPVLPESVSRIVDTVARRILNPIPNDRIADGNPNLRATNG